MNLLLYQPVTIQLCQGTYLYGKIEIVFKSVHTQGAGHSKKKQKTHFSFMARTS